MKDFRKLHVWEKGHCLALAIYKATKAFPQEEMYGLKAQIRRSVSSIPTNIAEGCGRAGNPEFARYLQIAMGSASETEYQLLLSRDLGLLKNEVYQDLKDRLIELKRMLSTLIQKVRSEC